MCSANRVAGFTLIELLITLAVLAIVLAFGVPAFNTLIENNRVTSQSNTLLMAINLARTEAIKRGDVVSIQSEPAGFSAGYCVIASGLTGCQNARNNNLLITEFPSSNGISMDDNGLNGLSFNRQGYRVSPGVGVNAEIELEPTSCGAGEQRRRLVTVSSSGRSSIQQAVCD